MVAIKGKGWVLAASLQLLIDQVNKTYPGRDRSSDGSIASAQHHQQNPTSDHEPYQGFVHAVDIDEDIAPGLDLKGFAAALEASRDPRVRYVIYEGRILKAYVSNGLPAWSWHRYGGPNTHSHHMHVSINRTAQARDDLRPWPLTLEDDMFGPAEAEKLDRIEKMLEANRWNYAGLKAIAGKVDAIDGADLSDDDLAALAGLVLAGLNPEVIAKAVAQHLPEYELVKK